MPPDTTVAFFAREDGRAKVAAVAGRGGARPCGGVVAAEQTLKARELPRWIVQEAAKLGLELDGGAARVLVAHVGERQQRLLRELEKLALERGPGTRLGVEEVEAVGGAVGRAPGLGPRRRARRARPAPRPSAPTSSCARRARRCRA